MFYACFKIYQSYKTNSEIFPMNGYPVTGHNITFLHLNGPFYWTYAIFKWVRLLLCVYSVIYWQTLQGVHHFLSNDTGNTHKYTGIYDL